MAFLLKGRTYCCWDMEARTAISSTSSKQLLEPPSMYALVANIQCCTIQPTSSRSQLDENKHAQVRKFVRMNGAFRDGAMRDVTYACASFPLGYEVKHVEILSSRSVGARGPQPSPLNKMTCEGKVKSQKDRHPGTSFQLLRTHCIAIGWLRTLSIQPPQLHHHRQCEP